MNKQNTTQKIVPFLWFNGQIEEAVNFYTSVFKDARVGNINPMTATFYLHGQEFMLLNGGPQFKFNEAVSFFVKCDTQEEVDYFWEKLSAGGEEGRCGWLKDQFGLSWQVIPNTLGNLMSDKDPAKANRVVQAMLKMNKIEINKLEEAYSL